MTIVAPRMQQDDEGLRLLAQMYSRWFMHAKVGSAMEGVFIHIRDILYSASGQQEAYEQLSQEVEAVSEGESLPSKAYDRARNCVQRLMEAGGSADALIVGQTDGHRHLCLTCSQDEQNFGRVRFFHLQERRPLLSLEVGDAHRSAYATCQLCLQPINPNALVIFTFAGTAQHTRRCDCSQCNRAGITYLLTIYACEEGTQRVLFPFLEQVAAPSRQKCVEQAITRCWENGWYMFNKDTMLP